MKFNPDRVTPHQHYIAGKSAAIERIRIVASRFACEHLSLTDAENYGSTNRSTKLINRNDVDFEYDFVVDLASGGVTTKWHPSQKEQSQLF